MSTDRFSVTRARLPPFVHIALALVVAACGSPAAIAPTAHVLATAQSDLIEPTMAVVDPANAPASGEIWFGKSFDVTTFAISGKTAKFKLGSQIAFVAHLSRVSSDEVVGLALNIGGLDATWPGAALPAGSEFYGQVLPAAEIYQAGKLVVQVVDVGGNVLAEGTVTVTKK